MKQLHTKDDIAARTRVCRRTVEHWIARGLLPKPLKFGTKKQSRVRWTDEHLAELDRNLAALSEGRKAA
jgi:DNA-binding transcriptional MerR regulator